MQGGHAAMCLSISWQAPGGSSRSRYSDSSEKISLHFSVRSCDSISSTSCVSGKRRQAAIGAQVFVQLLADSQASAMQARFNDVLRQIEDLGGLKRGQFLHIPQQDYGPVVFRQGADCPIEHLLQLRLQNQTIGQPGPIGDLELGVAARMVHRRKKGVQLEFLRWRAHRSEERR